MLAVWEPILPTDWQRPTSLVLSRIPDARVAQYWDKEHLVSADLEQQLSRSGIALNPHCCEQGGFLWDVAGLYPAQIKWANSHPLFIGGPVVNAEAGLCGALRNLLQIPAIASNPLCKPQ